MYRIKIEELKDGEIKYHPQKGYLHTSGGWIKKSVIRWENMYGVSFSTEKLALERIEIDKKWEEQKKGKEVKSTTYKIIE
jgi:hypothetical protein